MTIDGHVDGVTSVAATNVSTTNCTTTPLAMALVETPPPPKKN